MSHENSLTLITTLPQEIMLYNVFSFLTLEEIFEFCSSHDSYLKELLSAYMDTYMRTRKYTKKLADALFLLELEYFCDPVTEYIAWFCLNLAVTYVSLVNESGGPISYTELSLQEKPKPIYSIKITMRTNHNTLIYVFSNIGVSNMSNICFTSCSKNNISGHHQFIENNIGTINNKIVSIYNLMTHDPTRRITKMELNKELYSHNFMFTQQAPEIISIIKYD